MLKSELKNVVELQDAVNKLLADMMVAAEYGAFRQRWIISQADTSALRNGPNRVWEIPAGDGTSEATQVGDFQETALDGYLTAMDKLASSLAIITRTPKHYFFAQGGDPSGEALIAMEAPLIHKAQRLLERWGVAWRSVAAFMLQLQGITVAPEEITPVWDPVATVQPQSEALARKAAVEAGVPLAVQLKREGWSEAELAEVEKAKQAEDQASQRSLAAALVEQQRRFDQGQAEASGASRAG